MTTPYYAMFTDNGNYMVDAMVEAAINMKRDWNYVYEKLGVIAEADGFEEAMDTDVREHVHAKLVEKGYDAVEGWA